MKGGPPWTKLWHKLPPKGIKKVFAGTWGLDDLCTWMKERPHGTQAQCQKAIEQHVKEFHWKHWNAQQDLGQMVGDVLCHYSASK